MAPKLLSLSSLSSICSFPIPNSSPTNYKFHTPKPTLILCKSTEPDGCGAAAPTRGDIYLQRQQSVAASSSVLATTKKKKKKKDKMMFQASNLAPCCYGCGAPLHTSQVDAPGFVDQETYDLKKKHHQLGKILCGRCRLLSHGHMITAVGGNGGYSGGNQFVSAEELREKLSHLRNEKALIVKLVDIVDFNGSFLARVRDLSGGNPIILVITKVDLLPKETDLNCIGDWVVEATMKKKLNVLSVHLTSSKSLVGIAGVVSEIQKEKKGESSSLLCRLRRSLYGLKRSPRAWFGKFSTVIQLFGMIRSGADHSVFYRHSQPNLCIYLVVYVDDIVIIGNDEDDILEETGMMGCRPIDTPMDPNVKLLPGQGKPLSDPERCRRLVGKLNYLTVTRPYLSFPSAPGKGLLFEDRGHEHIIGYIDADWTGSPSNRRSTSGYCVLVGGNLVSWKSKKQSVVARSSAEAEYCELVWIKQLLRELKFGETGKMELGSANVGKSAFITALLNTMSYKDPVAASARKYKPIQSAVPGTTLGPIAIDAFLGGEKLYDTPGVHLHHRQAAVIHAEDLPVLAPQSRLRGRAFPSSGLNLSSEIADRVRSSGLSGLSIFWGGLVRIDVLKVSHKNVVAFAYISSLNQSFSIGGHFQVLPETCLTFYGPKALQIHIVPTEEADEFYQGWEIDPFNPGRVLLNFVKFFSIWTPGATRRYRKPCHWNLTTGKLDDGVTRGHRGASLEFDNWDLGALFDAVKLRSRTEN
ncbi:putative nitric oxide synthase [Capsicum annuum]|nr:putative nitric oxide synthase [Capsicum annuum]